jgi:hypothetical protein
MRRRFPQRARRVTLMPESRRTARYDALADWYDAQLDSAPHRHQVVHIDFPQSIVLLESGDSGWVLLETGTNRIVGLLFASGVDDPGEPIKYALANRISTVETVWASV